MTFNTKFIDKNYLLEDIPLSLSGSLKIAIHMHIYYADMIDIFVAYLKDAPLEFDLLISVISSENEQICRTKFTQKSLPKMRDIIIKITQNKGRDVAPFLIAFKEEMPKYDIIGHIHTKKSPHDKALSGWADYLLRNLISAKALENIIANFIKDEKIGIIFPPVYSVAFQHVLNLAREDEQNICELLSKLKINFSPNSHNFIFPAGTMFFARFDAIKSLFELNLKYDDFPPEPLSATTGTIAHAIERLFGIVCEHAGYKIKTYATRKEFVRIFFNNYYHFMENLELKKELKNQKEQKFECKFFGLRLFKISAKKADKILKFLPLKFKKIY